jgi:hypothetical protein
LLQARADHPPFLTQVTAISDSQSITTLPQLAVAECFDAVGHLG